MKMGATKVINSRDPRELKSIYRISGFNYQYDERQTGLGCLPVYAGAARTFAYRRGRYGTVGDSCFFLNLR